MPTPVGLGSLSTPAHPLERSTRDLPPHSHLAALVTEGSRVLDLHESQRIA